MTRLRQSQSQHSKAATWPCIDAVAVPPPQSIVEWPNVTRLMKYVGTDRGFFHPDGVRLTSGAAGLAPDGSKHSGKPYSPIVVTVPEPVVAFLSPPLPLISIASVLALLVEDVL